MSFLPARFRRPTVLIVGCGDVGLRVVRLLRAHWRVLALTTSPARVAALRAAGAMPLVGDLDAPQTLRVSPGLADAVLHLVPPPPHGHTDPRTTHLLQRAGLQGARAAHRATRAPTGVYGDCGGARFDETRTPCPATDRARRASTAEARLRWYGRAFRALRHSPAHPGIYAGDRAGGHPRERVARGTPVLATGDDVVHRTTSTPTTCARLRRALAARAPQRVVHASDDSELKMGDYFDLAADLAGLSRPPRIARAQAERELPPTQLSFMSESRRLDNRRLKRELKVALRYPTVRRGLVA
jgi:nucleoside-diphosphate-sugar epimerase